MMNSKNTFKEIFLCLIFFILIAPQILKSQYTSLTDVQNLSEGIYTFNFGNGDFQGYVDQDGWLLWMQYQHQGGTNPALRVIQAGNDLPIFDNSPLGADLSGDPSKWGHGSQNFAGSIPDENLWLRWEGETSHHNRKIHFESPVLGRFQEDGSTGFGPDISSNFIARADHTAELPRVGSSTGIANYGDQVLHNTSFQRFANNVWNISNNRWNVDDVRNSDGSLILNEYHTIHRVWVRPFTLMEDLNRLQDHINQVQILSGQELDDIENNIKIGAGSINGNEAVMIKALEVVADYDAQVGPLFTTPTTTNGILKNRAQAPGLELERLMITLQQAMFDYIFTPEVYNEFPEQIDGIRFNSCTNFPGDVAPPSNPNVSETVSIRANFEDPAGTNPSYGINGDGTEHAFRPTGLYLAPGSVATVEVPSSLVGKDYFIRVGAHEWDLSNKPTYKRLDRISKKFPINSTTVKVFNPFGGAIGILVPYGSTDGIKEVTIKNAVQAPFFSIKSFYETPDFDAELSKPAPWAVFESDNVMYTIPSHFIVQGRYDLKQTLKDWDTAMQAINTIMGRELVPDKHDLYMIADVLIRSGQNSIGYPMSNSPISFTRATTPILFTDGPSVKYRVNIHELGHSIRMSKFIGEQEALVNFPFVMAMNYGFGVDLDIAMKESFDPLTIDIDNTAIHRMVSYTFGGERNNSFTVHNEVRYQQRGYGHYTEIVNLFGWCALQNFWTQEYIDSKNGNDHGINNQDTDSRILRMSIAANADLRPLFHVFGIVPQDPLTLENDFITNNIFPSLTVYNRLQEYMDLIPKSKDEFLSHALKVYPNLMIAGPASTSNYGVGWHYQKYVNYNGTVANNIVTKHQQIIDTYFPNGVPSNNNEGCDGTTEQSPYQGVAGRIPGLIEGEHYDEGGQGIAFNDDGNKDGNQDYRSTDNVDVSGKGEGSNGNAVGWTNEGEWLEYTVDVTEGNYDIIFHYFCNADAGQLEVSLDGNLVATIDGMINQGDWNTAASITLPNVFFEGGNNKILRLELVNGSGFDIDAIEFVEISDPTADPQTPYQGLVGIIPGLIEGEHYDEGGQGIAFNDDGNKDGDQSYRSTDKVDVSGKGEGSNGNAVGWTNEGEWLEYTVDVTEGNYDIIFHYFCNADAGQLEVSLDGNVVATIDDITNQGDWNTAASTTLPNVFFEGGFNKILRLELVNGSGFDIDAIEFVENTDPTTDVQSPYQGVVRTIPGLIEGEHYDEGGQGIAFNDDDNKDGHQNFRSTDNVDVNGKAEGSNGYAVGWTKEGEWLEYTVDVTEGNYDIIFHYFCNADAGQLEVSLDGNVVATIDDISNQGDWNTAASTTLPNVFFEGGNNKILRLELVNGSGFDIDAIEFVPRTAQRSASAIINLDSKELAKDKINTAWPNPFENVILLKLAPGNTYKRVFVKNINGQKITNIEMNEQTEGEFSINIEGPSGIYLLYIETEEEIEVQKIIKR